MQLYPIFSLILASLFFTQNVALANYSVEADPVFYLALTPREADGIGISGKIQARIEKSKARRARVKTYQAVAAVTSVAVVAGVVATSIHLLYKDPVGGGSSESDVNSDSSGMSYPTPAFHFDKAKSAAVSSTSDPKRELDGSDDDSDEKVPLVRYRSFHSPPAPPEFHPEPPVDLEAWASSDDSNGDDSNSDIQASWSKRFYQWVKSAAYKAGSAAWNWRSSSLSHKKWVDGALLTTAIGAPVAVLSAWAVEKLTPKTINDKMIEEVIEIAQPRVNAICEAANGSKAKSIHDDLELQSMTFTAEDFEMGRVMLENKAITQEEYESLAAGSTSPAYVFSSAQLCY